MNQYNSLTVTFNRLKSAIKNETGAALRLSSNMIGNPNDETKFPRNLVLTNRQVINLCRNVANKSSTDIKLSKTQLFKMIQSSKFLGRLLGPLLNTSLPLMKTVIQLLAKSVLIPLEPSAASAAYVGLHKRIFGSGTTKLIIENNKMKEIINTFN